MTTVTFTPATGQLLLSRDELVALAEEIGAHRIRGLDGSGLVHVGVDPNRARAALRERGLGPEHADLLGSEAFWVRRVLGALCDRAVLLVRHEVDRVTSHLAGVHGSTAVVVKAVYDQPVTFGPISTVVCPAYLVEEIDAADFAVGVWSVLLGEHDHADALVRVIGWWRDDEGEHEASLCWMESADGPWRIFDDAGGEVAATPTQVAAVLRGRFGEVL